MRALRNRFWSCLAEKYHTPEQLEEGIGWVDEKYGENISFNETIILIVGIKD